MRQDTTAAADRPAAPTPAAPASDLLGWDGPAGVGRLAINGTTYDLTAIRHGGPTVGMRLTRVVLVRDPETGDKLPRVKVVDVDFRAPGGWACDCEDATYRPERPGGCKHCAALRAARPRGGW